MERSLKSVPPAVYLLLAGGLALQISWHAFAGSPRVSAEALPAPPSSSALRALSLGEPTSLARLSMLWLQAFDNQPGVSIPFRQLDYLTVTKWLSEILKLDPHMHYPLLSATRVYAEVAEPSKQRIMLDFAFEKFSEAPNERWPWLAHAAYVAKHRMHDLPLALEYARALAAEVTDPSVPSWATQMHIFILEDMGELESAKVLIGGLLESGNITDIAELNFLTSRLDRLEAEVKQAGEARGGR
jgi:hypothetical protein